MENKLTQFIFDRSEVPTFRKYLDLSSMRHKLVSGNLANGSTPDYKAQDIDFQEEFARLTKQTNHLAGVTTHPNHLPTGQSEMKAPKIEKTPVDEGDLNSVDIDREISTLAQNELLYTVGAKLLQQRFEGLRTAIKSK